MARTMSAAVTAAKNTLRPLTCVLLQIAVSGGPTFRFTDLPASFTFAAATWLPYLLWDGQLRFSRGLEIDGGAVKLSNVDLALAKEIRDTNFEGAAATLQRLYLEPNEAVTLGVFRITSAVVVEQSAEFRLAGFFEPTAVSLPKRNYSVLCPWRFKGAECGYVGVETVCDKTFANCTTRANTHRFGGFLHITRDVTDAVEGPQGGGGSGGGGGDESGYGFGKWYEDGILLP